MGAARKTEDAGSGRRYVPMTMAQFSDEVRRLYTGRPNGTSTHTLARLNTLSKMLVEIGIRTTDDINDAAIERFETEGLGGLPPGSRSYFRRLFRAVCRNAFKANPPLLSAVPKFPMVSPEISGKEQGVPPSSAEVQTLLDYLKDRGATWKEHRLFALLATLLWTALLRKEVCRMRVEDIDLETGTIRVRSREGRKKTKYRPMIRISDTLKQTLEGWIPRVGPDCEWAFPGDHRIGPWVEVRAALALRTAAREAGVEAAGNMDALRRFSEEAGVWSIPGIKPGTPPQPTGDPTSSGVARQLEAVWEPNIEEATRLMALLRAQSASWERHRLYAVAGLALFAGLRTGSIVNLRVEHVHLDRSTPMVLIPDHAPVKLCGGSMPILRGWLQRPDRAETPWVFPNVSLTGPWPIDHGWGSYGPVLRKAAQEAGIRARVNLDVLASLRSRHAHPIELGHAFYATPDPERILDGPRQPRGQVPDPETARKRRRRTNIGTLPDLATWDPPISAVQVNGPYDPVFVRGLNKGVLGDGQYKIITTLIGSSQGLTRVEITKICGVAAPRQIVDKLVKDPDWRSAIIEEQAPDGRVIYRIANI